MSEYNVFQVRDPRSIGVGPKEKYVAMQGHNIMHDVCIDGDWLRLLHNYRVDALLIAIDKGNYL
jgi:hypothetical protein